jgi:hypothetical protein
MEEIRFRHVPMQETDFVTTPPVAHTVCSWCEWGDGHEDWPCDAAVLLAALGEPTEPQRTPYGVMPAGTRLILASEDLLATWGTRTEDGARITAEWGEPTAEGWYEPTFTVHADDTLGEPTEPVGDLDAHPESYCHRCGGPNVVWSASSPLWNEVMRGGDINGSWQWDEIICPTCFMALAESAGIASLFYVDAERVNVPLQTVTPSGRVWNENRRLFDDPEENR